MFDLYSNEWAGASAYAAIWCRYPPPPPPPPPPSHPTMLTSISEVAMATGCLTSQWMALAAWAHWQANLKSWLWSTEQIALSSLSRIFFFPPPFFFFLLFWDQICRLDFVSTLAKLKWKIFDKCPAWSVMSVWSMTCFCTCSVIFLLLFSVHGLSSQGLKSVCWLISYNTLLNVILLFNVSFLNCL